MLSSIKAYVMAALAVAVGVLAALWQHSRASHANDKLAGEKAAREVEKKDAKATAEGLQDEAKVIDTDVDADHFS